MVEKLNLVLTKFIGNDAVLEIRGSAMNGRYLLLPPKVLVEFLQVCLKNEEVALVIETNNLVVEAYKKFLK